MLVTYVNQSSGLSSFIKRSLSIRAVHNWMVVYNVLVFCICYNMIFVPYVGRPTQCTNISSYKIQNTKHAMNSIHPTILISLNTFKNIKICSTGISAKLDRSKYDYTEIDIVVSVFCRFGRIC